MHLGVTFVCKECRDPAFTQTCVLSYDNYDANYCYHESEPFESSLVLLDSSATFTRAILQGRLLERGTVLSFCVSQLNGSLKKPYRVSRLIKHVLKESVLPRAV